MWPFIGRRWRAIRKGSDSTGYGFGNKSRKKKKHNLQFHHLIPLSLWAWHLIKALKLALKCEAQWRLSSGKVWKIPLEQSLRNSYCRNLFESLGTYDSDQWPCLNASESNDKQFAQDRQQPIHVGYVQLAITQNLNLPRKYNLHFSRLPSRTNTHQCYTVLWQPKT